MTARRTASILASLTEQRTDVQLGLLAAATFRDRVLATVAQGVDVPAEWLTVGAARVVIARCAIRAYTVEAYATTAEDAKALLRAELIKQGHADAALACYDSWEDWASEVDVREAVTGRVAWL